MAAAYRRDRIEAFLNPWSDARGSGYQIIQSLIAVGTGGVTRRRPHGRTPEALLPALSLQRLHLRGDRRGAGPAGRRPRWSLAFVFFLWRGLRAAWKAPDDFGLFLAAGLTLAIVLQAFINMSVVLGLVPTKGIPLPFISAGGSSLVFTLVGVGLILNVSQHAD